MDESTTTRLALLLLADARFPAGGHAHSAGVEAALADGRVDDETSLESYVHGRLVTVGRVDAALAAATSGRLRQAADAAAMRAVLGEVDREAEARIVVPALRAASRRLGRQLVRAAARCWPSGELALLADEFPGGAHQSVTFGCVGVAIGATPTEVAELVVHHTATTATQAAVRLIGMDPFAVAAAAGPLRQLPARSAPLSDIAATAHAAWPVKHFAT